MEILMSKCLILLTMKMKNKHYKVHKTSNNLYQGNQVKYIFFVVTIDIP